PLFLLFAIDQLMDMGRTAVTVLGNCVACVVIARWKANFRRSLRRRANPPPELVAKRVCYFCRREKSLFNFGFSAFLHFRREQRASEDTCRRIGPRDATCRAARVPG